MTTSNTENLICITKYATLTGKAYRTVRKIIKNYNLTPVEGSKYLKSDLDEAFKKHNVPSESQKQRIEKEKSKKYILDNGLHSTSDLLSSLKIKRDTFLRLIRVKKELKAVKINGVLYFTDEQFNILADYCNQEEHYDIFSIKRDGGVLLSNLSNKTANYLRKNKKEAILTKGRYQYVIQKTLDSLSL